MISSKNLYENWNARIGRTPETHAPGAKVRATFIFHVNF
jgi:hypothetical protein